MLRWSLGYLKLWQKWHQEWPRPDTDFSVRRGKKKSHIIKLHIQFQIATKQTFIDAWKCRVSGLGFVQHLQIAVVMLLTVSAIEKWPTCLVYQYSISYSVLLYITTHYVRFCESWWKFIRHWNLTNLSRIWSYLKNMFPVFCGRFLMMCRIRFHLLIRGHHLHCGNKTVLVMFGLALQSHFFEPFA